LAVEAAKKCTGLFGEKVLMDCLPLEISRKFRQLAALRWFLGEGATPLAAGKSNQR
jgi:hypothetical protein